MSVPQRRVDFWRLYQHLRDGHHVDAAVLAACRTTAHLTTIHDSYRCDWPKEAS